MSIQNSCEPWRIYIGFITILVDTISSDFSCPRMSGGIIIITISLCDSITITVYILR